MPWEAIKYVSSGVTLLAFIAAIVLQIYRRTLLSRERLIELAPAAERARLVKSTLQEFFDVDTARMSEDHAYQLAMEQIRARSRRYLVNAFVSSSTRGRKAVSHSANSASGSTLRITSASARHGDKKSSPEGSYASGQFLSFK